MQNKQVIKCCGKGHECQGSGNAISSAVVKRGSIKEVAFGQRVTKGKGHACRVQKNIPGRGKYSAKALR